MVRSPTPYRRFGEFLVLNRPGAVDLNVDEYDTSTPEFQLTTILVSQDGLAYTDIKASQVAVVDIPGDGQHGTASFARSHDLGALPWVRCVRVQGLSNVAPGPQNGFDPDAVGAHAVATPVPEPASWAMLLGGIAMLAARRRTTRD
jgi:hypothetical protein